MGVNYLPFETAPATARRGIRWQRVALIFVFLWFLIGGAAHFVATEAEMRIVPPSLPDPRDIVLITGLFELLGAFGLMLPWTRRLAGWGLFALTIAVTPAHFYMLHAHDQFPSLPMWLLWVRLPVQAVLLWLILWGSRWRPGRTMY
ncbi:MAG: DoxX family protein [Burkholderiaceae bacterium]